MDEAVPANHVRAQSQDSESSAATGIAEDDTEEEEVAEVQEEDEEVLSPNEDVDPSALDGLGKFISSLETSRKRKGDNDLTNGSLPRKRRLTEEKTAAGVEGEFTAVTSGTSHFHVSDTLTSMSLGQQLRLDDLLAPLSSRSSAALFLKDSIKVLDSRTRGAPLPAPLPQRAQDRLDREAAYEQTKTEVDKWNETMRQIKEVVPIHTPSLHCH